MQKPKLITPVASQSEKQTRVAAYCRVSTNSADQQNSYANQIRTYTKMINQRPDWELVDIFADEGLSGMKANNRTEFQRMIRMCELHQIDLIITKSVSRFGRNVMDSLTYARKLKLLGIGIQFEENGINTLALGDEMLLSTFAAIAQEESQAISQNVRLTNRKLMEKGEYIAINAPYGFRLVDKELVIYEPEAKVVRTIYDLYLNGWSMSEIARELVRLDIPSKSGAGVWSSQTISYILTNERYIGDSLFQKKIRETTVPFKQHVNRGEEDMFYARNTHPAIVEKEKFEKVQSLIAKRQEKFSHPGACIPYPLTSRIRCAECGSFYHRKISKGTIKWVCTRHERNAKACDSFYFAEERIYDGFISMINKLRFGEEDILGQVIAKLENATLLYKQNNRKAQEASQSIAELNAKLLMLEQLRSKGYLATDIFQSQSREIQAQISNLRAERQSSFESRLLEMLKDVRKLKALIFEIEEPLEEFDERLFQEIVRDITINKSDEMTVAFLGGLSFTEII